jgi:ATP-dependent DNA ligase
MDTGRSRGNKPAASTCSPGAASDWTERYLRISAAVAALRPASVSVDGEAVCCDDAGVAVFEKLHSRAHDGEVFLYALDLLELDGEDWRPREFRDMRGDQPKPKV